VLGRVEMVGYVGLEEKGVGFVKGGGPKRGFKGTAVWRR
jgi:hypothetical protein